MKILVVSDTHGYNSLMWKVIEKEKPFDLLLHCGDLEGDPDIVFGRLSDAVLTVSGNNDYAYGMRSMISFPIGRRKAIMVHGHRHHVYSDLSSLCYLAEENSADTVFFGHLHVPIAVCEGGITLLNPGSLTYPRQKGRKPTYMIVNTDDEGGLEYEVKEVEE